MNGLREWWTKRYPAKMTAALSACDVGFRYGRGVSFGPWNFQVGRGERVGLAGESGAGKTSMLDLLAGLRPVSLEILHGEVKSAGTIAYISQEPLNSLSPYLTVLEQVTAFCGDRTAAERELARVGISGERFRNARPHELSGGERRRVQVAQALAMKSDFILADEPAAGLDRETADLVLQALAETPAGLLVASHRQEVFSALQCSAVHRLAPAQDPGVWPGLGDPGETVLEVRDLDHIYTKRDFWMRRRPAGFALKGICFAIRAGETVLLSGRSGSGKSTLARCLARRSAAVQVVPQEPSNSLNPRQRLDEAFREANPRADAAEALERMGIDPAWVKRRACELSEGQRARIAIGRAMSALPEGGTLILDESLSGLDEASERLVMRSIAAEQRRTGLACLVISHASRFPFHRMVEMRDGRIA